MGDTSYAQVPGIRVQVEAIRPRRVVAQLIARFSASNDNGMSEQRRFDIAVARELLGDLDF